MLIGWLNKPERITKKSCRRFLCEGKGATKEGENIPDRGTQLAKLIIKICHGHWCHHFPKNCDLCKVIQRVENVPVNHTTLGNLIAMIVAYDSYIGDEDFTITIPLEDKLADWYREEALEARWEYEARSRRAQEMEDNWLFDNSYSLPAPPTSFLYL